MRLCCGAIYRIVPDRGASRGDDQPVCARTYDVQRPGAFAHTGRLEDQAIAVEPPAARGFLGTVGRSRGDVQQTPVPAELETAPPTRGRDGPAGRPVDLLTSRILLVRMHPAAHQHFALDARRRHGCAPIALRGPSSAARMRSTCWAVNMHIVSSST
jgi:hypothetical protein